MKELVQKWARTLDDMENAAERIARNQAAHRHADDVLTARVGAHQHRSAFRSCASAANVGSAEFVSVTLEEYASAHETEAVPRSGWA